jgi:hypothetical protein
MILKSGNRFSEKIMLKETEIEPHPGSIRMEQALGRTFGAPRGLVNGARPVIADGTAGGGKECHLSDT